MQSQIKLDYALVGKRVREARKAKKITQAELCERCGCTAAHLSRLENGKAGTSLELLYSISIELEQSMDYFLMDNPLTNPKIKFDHAIVGKLIECNSQTLDVVEGLLDRLLVYQHGVEKMIGERMS